MSILSTLSLSIPISLYSASAGAEIDLKGQFVYIDDDLQIYHIFWNIS